MRPGNTLARRNTMTRIKTLALQIHDPNDKRIALTIIQTMWATSYQNSNEAARRRIEAKEDARAEGRNWETDPLAMEHANYGTMQAALRDYLHQWALALVTPAEPTMTQQADAAKYVANLLRPRPDL